MGHSRDLIWNLSHHAVWESVAQHLGSNEMKPWTSCESDTTSLSNSPNWLCCIIHIQNHFQSVTGERMDLWFSKLVNMLPVTSDPCQFWGHKVKGQGHSGVGGGWGQNWFTNISCFFFTVPCISFLSDNCEAQPRCTYYIKIRGLWL